MSDVWEHVFDAEDVLPGDDTDSDGQSNLEESYAWTDSFDQNDVLSLTLVAEAGGLALEWEEHPGASYFIEASSDLESWVPLSEFAPAIGSVPGAVSSPPGAGEYIDMWNLWMEGSDGFGLLWSPHYGFNGSGTRPAADYLPDADPDFDGLENHFESLANTDPFAIGSRLTVALARSESHLVLTWSAANGLDRYRLETPVAFSSYDPALLAGSAFDALTNAPASAFFGAAPSAGAAEYRLESFVPGETWSAETQGFMPEPALPGGVAMASGATIEAGVDGYAYLRWIGADGFDYIVRTRLRIGDWYLGRVALSGSHASAPPAGAHVSYRLHAVGEEDIDTTFTLAEWHQAIYQTDEREDWDNDGIPTVWEAQHGLDPLDPSNAFADPDGDALNNLEEWLDGRDPNVAETQAVVLSVAPAAVGLVVIMETWDPSNDTWITPVTVATGPGAYTLYLPFGERFRFSGATGEADVTFTPLEPEPIYWIQQPSAGSSGGSGGGSSGPLGWEKVFVTMYVDFSLPPCLLLNDNQDEFKGAPDMDDDPLQMNDPETGNASGVLMFNDLMGDRLPDREDMIRVSPRKGVMFQVPDGEFRIVRTPLANETGKLRFHAIKTRDGSDLLNPGLETRIQAGVDISPNHLKTGAPFKSYRDLAEGIITGKITYELRWIVDSVIEEKWPSTCEVLARSEALTGAEGFGKWSIGGKCGPEIEVTDLTDNGDDKDPTPGTLRWALKHPDNAGPKRIKFTVAGYIELQSPLSITDPFVTIDGSTAPGDGICLRDEALNINADHVIIRHIRSRPGDATGTTGRYDTGSKQHDHDGISIVGARHVIIDHCSVSYSVDELMSVGDPDFDTDNITIQWCLIGHPLHQSLHHKGGTHGYGSLLAAAQGAKYSVHHNLYAHCAKRAPRPTNKWEFSKDSVGGYIEFRNNLIYNWGNDGNKPAAGMNWDDGVGTKRFDSYLRYNLISNDYRHGSNTAQDPKPPAPTAQYWIFEDYTPRARGVFEGNSIDGITPANPQQWDFVRLSKFENGEVTAYKNEAANGPFGAGSYGVPATQAAGAAATMILNTAGANHSRDALDTEIANDVGAGTGAFINSPAGIGAWAAGYPPLNP